MSHATAGGLPVFQSRNANRKVPLWREANSCTQTPNILALGPSMHSRARTLMQAVLLQRPNVKRRGKQQGLEVHQIGFSHICRRAATTSVSNSTLPEKAITVHVLN